MLAAVVARNPSWRYTKLGLDGSKGRFPGKRNSGFRALGAIHWTTEIAGAEISIQRFVSIPPNVHATGNIESMALLAGQSVGLIHDIRPAGEIVRETIAGAERLIRALSERFR
jgi:hypothetical protein